MADPQHPDIAALVERLPLAADKLKAQGAGSEARDVEDAEAALRTLTRPVEDEQTAKWLRRFRAYGGEFEEAASLLARLVRERDHLHHARVLAAEDAARRLEQATRAEQEAARLRERLADLAGKVKLHKEAIRFDFSRDCESARHEMWAAAERALAGTEE
jgi:hypothetical protein